jgi:hypothetical protein
MSKLLTVLLIVCLLCSFVICNLASYLGYGVRQIGERHPNSISVRSGSVLGPRVGGGGPGAGK